MEKDHKEARNSEKVLSVEVEKTKVEATRNQHVDFGQIPVALVGQIADVSSRKRENRQAYVFQNETT